MFEITVFENNDERQARTFRANTKLGVMSKLIRWATDGLKDFCIGFDADGDPVYVLGYSESYKDFEFRETIGDVDADSFATYSDALDFVMDYIYPRIHN